MKTERKLYVALWSLLITIMLLWTAFGGRVITPSSDDSLTKIRCSNGNIYNATAADLQDAIESMNNQTGKVTLSASMNISIGSTLQLYDKVELDMNGAQLWATADTNIIYMHPASCIHDGKIDVTGVAFTKACIYLSGVDDHSPTAAGGLKDPTCVYNMVGESESQQGYFLHLYIPNTAGDHQIGLNRFRGIKTSYFNTSIYFQNVWRDTGDGGWINGNLFSDLTGYADNTFINLTNTVRYGTSSTWTAVDGNSFTDIQYQPSSGISETGISCDGDWNTFVNVNIWDASSSISNASIFIRTGANYNSVWGFAELSSVKDMGTYNSIFSGGSGSTSARAGSQTYGMNLSALNRYEPDAAGIKFYEATDSQPYTYFYGYDTGASAVKFGAFRISSAGTWEFISDSGERISFLPNNGGAGVVSIDDVLKLDGRTTAPTSPEEGMIYYNTTSNTLMLYTTAWHSINIT